MRLLSFVRWGTTSIHWPYHSVTITQSLSLSHCHSFSVSQSQLTHSQSLIHCQSITVTQSPSLRYPLTIHSLVTHSHCVVWLCQWRECVTVTHSRYCVPIFDFLLVFTLLQWLITLIAPSIYFSFSLPSVKLKSKTKTMTMSMNMIYHIII